MNLIGRWRVIERAGADGSAETARDTKSAPRKETRSERLRRTRWKQKEAAALETP